MVEPSESDPQPSKSDSRVSKSDSQPSKSDTRSEKETIERKLGKKEREISADIDQFSKLFSASSETAAIADPSVKPVEALEGLARQLAPAVDWVWGGDDRADKTLLSAAGKLLKECGGDVGGTLDALDSYLASPKNRKWAREEASDPHWLVKSVAGQYQKNRGQERRQAVTRDSWVELAEESQSVGGPVSEPIDPWWEAKLRELQGSMDGGVFRQWIKPIRLISREPLVLGVTIQMAPWIERLGQVIERVVGDFEVVVTEPLNL